MRHTNRPKWIGFAALAACGALGFVLARFPGDPSLTGPADPPEPPPASLIARDSPQQALPAARVEREPARTSPASAAPPSLAGEDSPTARESALMFAAEPGLIDVLEDATSSDPAVRAEAERFLEELDVDRLRENVTRLPR